MGLFPRKISATLGAAVWICAAAVSADARLVRPALALNSPPSQSADGKSKDGAGRDSHTARTEPIAPIEHGRTPVSLAITVSGGVSLGAYQAGYLYYLTETAKRNPNLFDIRLVTGASAGMINALLTIISMGRPTELNTDPAESLFYKVWTEMRYQDLLDVDNAPPGALSSRKELNRLADLIEAEWSKGGASGLDMVLGAAATRFEGRNVAVSESLHARALEEKFAIRIEGRGPGRAPRVSNYVDRRFPIRQALLPLTDEETAAADRRNFSHIRELLFASSAIPVVFRPQEMGYCLTDPPSGDSLPTAADKPCRKPEYTDFFADGGIVDRKPLRLAYRIARSGLVHTDRGRNEWREKPDLEGGTLPDNMFFLYVDPRSPGYPSPANDEEDEFFAETAKVFRTAGRFFKGMFRSVQSKELYTLIEEHPEIRSRIQLAAHDFPTMGGQLANFFGFFDRKLRAFDFYLGMRDARRFVAETVTRRLRHVYSDNSVVPALPEARFTASDLDGLDNGWRPFFCLRASIDGEKQFERACRTSALYDFRILTQATLDRLYNFCAGTPPEVGADNEHCMAARAGKSPPRVWGVKRGPKGAWRQKPGGVENRVAHTLRLLDNYDFHFEDLGLDRGDADLAMSRIREELLLYVDTFAKKLRYGEAVAVRILGKPAINFFAYSPPAGIVYLIAGTGAELALSATLGKFKWIRFNFALEVEGFNLFLTNKPNAVALTPAAGMELELLPISSPLLQTRLGARIGYQFSSEDKFLTGSCDTEWFSNDPIRCSAPVTQFFAAVVFYERIRLQIGVEWYPKWLPPMNRFDDHLFSGMVEVGWQWISPF